MNTLLILDDLAELLSSKNKTIQKLLSAYLQHLARSADGAAEELLRDGDTVFAAGPQEVLSRVTGPCEKLDYGIWFDTIPFARGGEIAGKIVEQIRVSEELKSICPFLYRNTISIPKIAAMRLIITFCYHAVNNYLLLESIIRKKQIQKIVVLGSGAEIEILGKELSKKHRLQFQVMRPHDVILKLKVRFADYLFYRDRKLHALQSFQNCDSLPKQEIKKRNHKKLIAMLPAHSLHFKIMDSLMGALRQSRNYEPCVLLQDAFEPYQGALKNSGIAFRFLHDFSSRELMGKFQNYFKNLKSAWKKLRNSDTFKSAFDCDGLNWFDILRVEMEWFFKFSYAETLVLQERLRKAMADVPIDSVFTFSDSRFFEAGGAAIAREMKKPSFLYSPNFLYDTDGINDYDTAEFVLTVGNQMKDYIAARGKVNPSQIFTVGDIRFDGSEKWRSSDQAEKTRVQLQIPSDKKVFILTSFYTCFGYNAYDKKRFFEMIRDAAKANPDVAIVIKAHPNESEEVLRQFVKSLGMSDFPLTKTMPLYSLFGISSGLISLTSLAAVEAMALDLPVIIATLPDRNYDYYIPFRQSDSAAYAASAEELSLIFRKLIDESNYKKNLLERHRQFVSRYVDRGGQSAGQRVIQVLDKIVNSERENLGQL